MCIGISASRDTPWSAALSARRNMPALNLFERIDPSRFPLFIVRQKRKLDLAFFSQPLDLLLLLAVSAIVGCTIIPKTPTERAVATYSGNDLNDGLIAALYVDPVKRGGFSVFLVTQGWIDRYNAYAADYGYLLGRPLNGTRARRRALGIRAFADYR